MNTFELKLEDFQDGELSSVQFTDISDCPLARAIKRVLPVDDLVVGIDTFRSIGETETVYYDFTEYQGKDQVLSHLQNLKGGHTVMIGYSFDEILPHLKGLV